MIDLSPHEDHRRRVRALLQTLRLQHDYRAPTLTDPNETKTRRDGAQCRHCSAFVTWGSLESHRADAHSQRQADPEQLGDEYDVLPATLLSAPFRNRIPDPNARASYRLSQPYYVTADGIEIDVKDHQSGQSAHSRAMHRYEESFHSGRGLYDHEEAPYTRDVKEQGRHVKGDKAVAMYDSKRTWIEDGTRRVEPKPTGWPNHKR